MAHPWHAYSAEETARVLQTNLERGLTESEAQERLRADGLNILNIKSKISFLKRFAVQFHSPLVYLLFFAAGLTLFFGRPTDWIVILIAAFMNSAMGALQEERAEKSLLALKKLSVPKVTVVREGRERTIESSHVAVGDIVILHAGDLIPADIRICEQFHARANEAVLTGEAESVFKTSDILAGETPLIGRRNLLFSGTQLVAGRAYGIVYATGWNSEMGSIAHSALHAKPPKTPIEKRIETLCNQLGIAAIGMCFLLFVIGWIQGLPWEEVFMAAISEIVSIIPEGLPIAITIALAVGVRKMAENHALVKHLHAVETLGSTTVICSDKTGTLTQNLLSVAKIYVSGREILQSSDQIRGDPSFSSLLTVGVLCNDAALASGDPTERALLAFAKKHLHIASMRKKYARTGEIPFDAREKIMATEHRIGNETLIAIKGAIESVLPLCSSYLFQGNARPLPQSQREQILKMAESQAREGMRILACAYIPQGALEKKEGWAQFLQKAVFIGFFALEDLPREAVFSAIQACREAGVRPVMITGDHALTARAFAEKLGIYREGDRVIDGPTFDALSEEELLPLISRISVFARMHPLQKLKIVALLQKKGEVVAMTGDGVNDAPALAKADVGVAMGSGTEIAKDIAKLTLLDDNFATIVGAVERGRIVYKNIKLVVYYLLSTSIAGAFLMLFAVILGYPLPMTAVQILWINVITEGTVTINLIMEEGEGNEMTMPPPKISDRVISFSLFKKMAALIPALAGILFIYFLLRVREHAPLPLIQTEVFTLLAFSAWFKVLSCRSETASAFKRSLGSNPYLAWGLLTGIALHFSVVYIPMLNKLFQTVPLSIHRLALLLGIASSILWIDEVLKWMARRRLRRKNSL